MSSRDEDHWASRSGYSARQRRKARKAAERAGEEAPAWAAPQPRSGPRPLHKTRGPAPHPQVAPGPAPAFPQPPVPSPARPPAAPAAPSAPARPPPPPPPLPAAPKVQASAKWCPGTDLLRLLLRLQGCRESMFLCTYFATKGRSSGSMEGEPGSLPASETWLHV